MRGDIVIKNVYVYISFPDVIQKVSNDTLLVIRQKMYERIKFCHAGLKYLRGLVRCLDDGYRRHSKQSCFQNIAPIGILRFA